MSNTVIVQKEIKISGSAEYQGNVGLLIPKKKVFDSCFVADASESDWTSTTGANGCTLAHSAADGGAMTMTMGGTNDDCGEFYHTAQWSAASNCGMLAKVKISQDSDINVCVGFVDAYENTNDHVAMEMSGAAFRACSNTADFAGMVYDTDATTDVWYYGCSNDGTEGTPAAATGSLTPTADTYFYIVVQTDTSGNVFYYYGTSIDRLVPVGQNNAGIAYASTNLLTPYVGTISRSTDATVCTISRIIVWQDN